MKTVDQIEVVVNGKAKRISRDLYRAILNHEEERALEEMLATRPPGHVPHPADNLTWEELESLLRPSTLKGLLTHIPWPILKLSRYSGGGEKCEITANHLRRAPEKYRRALLTASSILYKLKATFKDVLNYNSLLFAHTLMTTWLLHLEAIAAHEDYQKEIYGLRQRLQRDELFAALIVYELCCFAYMTGMPEAHGYLNRWESPLDHEKCSIPDYSKELKNIAGLDADASNTINLFKRLDMFIDSRLVKDAVEQLDHLGRALETRAAVLKSKTLLYPATSERVEFSYKKSRKNQKDVPATILFFNLKQICLAFVKDAGDDIDDALFLIFEPWRRLFSKNCKKSNYLFVDRVASVGEKQLRSLLSKRYDPVCEELLKFAPNESIQLLKNSLK